MPNDVHGHAVLEMILEAPDAMSRDWVLSSANARFGADATYYTCSASAMSIEDLLEFLVTRRKITIADDIVTAYRERMCTHE
jgi:probable metal-binding protein